MEDLKAILAYAEEQIPIGISPAPWKE